jgi:hypothetical protein
MKPSQRYRIEDGRPCIDIRAKTAQQLFDTRDPAPFRARDLDEDAVDYILAAAEEIGHEGRLKIAIWFTDDSRTVSDESVIEAIRGHFRHELDKLERRVRNHVRHAQLTLAAALVVLVIFLTGAELTSMMPAGHVRQILHEGFVIIGWVAVWRPLELLLYDWWPLVQQRRLLAGVHGADISIVQRDELVDSRLANAAHGITGEVSDVKARG